MMNNNINHQELTKRDKYLLEREQKEKERSKRMQSKGKKKIIIIALPLILAAGGIFGLLNYLPKENQSAQEESQGASRTEINPLKFNQAIGKEAPDFVLPDFDGKTVKISDYRGKIVVLFFTEGVMCYPACWDQILAFEKDERFNTNDVVALSIVVDEKSEWQKVIKQVPEFSKAKILFDSNRKISTAYNVLSLPSSMHPPSAMHPEGYPGHTYFVIDKEGIVRFTFDDPSMGIRNDLLISELSKL